MKPHHLILCCALLLLTAGCRSQRQVAQAATSAPEQQATPALPRPRCANFTCSTQGFQATGQLRMQPDSLIWASATKIVELGRAQLTPDSVLVYSRVVSRCFRGSWEDLCRRFHYRTSFSEVQTLLTADDADRQIAALLRQLRIDAAVHIGSWKEVEQITFPFSIPANTRPL